MPGKTQAPPPLMPDIIKKRKCNRCRKRFKSIGPWNWRCPKCEDLLFGGRHPSPRERQRASTRLHRKGGIGNRND